MIISRGGESFARTGTEKSTGTKVFSLVGKIKNTGLVELPLGTKLKTLIYDIGGGVGNEKKVKAVQTGGPSGGCIPASKFSSTIDYEALAEIGAIMGSGGVVVMDEDNCMVDVAHYFTEFTTSESCGKCVPCREGINHSLAMLSQIKKGEGSIELLNELQTLSDVIKDSALCGLGQTGPNPVVTTMKYFRDEYLMHIKEHYCDGGVCEDLFKSPCQNSCPLHMNIPGYLQLLKEDRVEEAFELVIRENPLPSSLGRICHFHCKMRCRRDDIDAPVAQGEVHRYIADKIYQEGKLDGFAQTLKKEIKIKGGKKIAIIGSGPAGLSAAFYLSLLGHKVKVFEKKNEPGGILRWGIPPYRLPREILKREIDFIEKLGVDIKTSREINASEFKKLKKEHDAVVIAAGAYKSRRLDIPGADIKGVISGTDFLEDTSLYEKSLSGENVVVIGGGNVAVDAARTALRLGAKVNIVYRRGENEMPAIKQEIEDAKEENIQFSFWRSPQKFKAKDGKLKSVELKVNVPGSYDYSGRRKPVPSSEKEVMDCGLAIVAVGESVDRDFLDNCSIDISSRGGAKVDLFTMKASEGVYAAGDIVSGPATAAEAMAQGKKLARSLDFDLMGKNRFKIFDKNFNYEQKASRKPSGKGPAGTKKMSVSKRKNNFNEVRKGFTL
ncbi:MAG: FAD-dependent oxidoreductase, partial [Elusimicrobiota bacterium]